MLQLYLLLLENLLTQKADRQEHIVMVYAHILATWHWRIYFVFCEHGVWDRILVYSRDTFCAYRVLWMCWQGTLLSKGTYRNFEEIPLTWLLTIRKSLSSARQVQALGGAFGVKYPLPLQTSCAETASHSCCGAGRCDSWQFHFAISQDQNCQKVACRCTWTKVVLEGQVLSLKTCLFARGSYENVLFSSKRSHFRLSICNLMPAAIPSNRDLWQGRREFETKRAFCWQSAANTSVSKQ